MAIISGGTATNSLIPAFNNISNICKISFVLPVSDNGGSSAEILRVFGGPAIGDLRSRITKLASLQDKKSSQANHEDISFGSFFNHRISTIKSEADNEWRMILSGTHQICGLLINAKFRNYVLFLLIYLNKQLIDLHKDFNFQNASIGNLFMLSLRLLYGFDLYQCADFFVRFVGINRKFTVIPSINSKDQRYNIAALLDNGDIIRGQSQISHPSTSTSKPKLTQLSVPSDIDLSTIDLNEPQLIFQKDHSEPLISPINRIYYIEDKYHEYQPKLFDQAQKILEEADVIIYSIGSLFTSIIPVLVLRGTGEAMAVNCFIDSIQRKKKIFLLNGNSDRETGGFNSLDFIGKTINSLLYSLKMKSELDLPSPPIMRENYEFVINLLVSHGIDPVGISVSLLSSLLNLILLKNQFFHQSKDLPPLSFSDFITHIFVLDQTDIEVNTMVIERILGIKCVIIRATVEEEKNVNDSLFVNTPTRKVIHYKYDLDDFQTKLEMIMNS
ncbi:hypothetical protein DASC09_042070 [Saccharomycopsis crataegensis]|uniref:Uncharacterized protein n=1 Tax=Saccharomycopsis crataegensis TaxID=43959 RepID=A0AAV5QPV2_9ASCO|nr:hypothetical protein DASC09_042070 [Saccharomycopsis crataegensis]